MPSWKKLVTSGSNAAIPSVSSTGDFTIDAGADIVLDADGADIVLKDGGTHFGSIKRVTSDLVIKSETQDKDIVFKGNDGGATITAMTMDMSEGGKVGIGTTSPLYALHVEAGNDLPAKFSNDGDRARLLINDNDTEGYVIVQNSKFSIGQANSVSTNNLTIDGSGNVGIGDTSPSVKLDITGEIHATTYMSGSAFVAKQKPASMTGANNINLSVSANHNITITGDVTLTPTNFSTRLGQSGIITLIQDSTGGHSITLNSLFKTPRGDSIAFDTTADGISLMSYYVIDASNVAVNYLGPFS
tara:strand:+ start:734 stop:1636 length:903 start_codon:yes stop_codon:yes gene_type:complete